MRLIYHPDAESELIEAARHRDFPDRLHILAFKHYRRHPDYWRYRVSE